MSILKRVAAFLTAVGFAASMTACGSNTTQALEVNGYQVPAGVYIYFANNAYNSALNQLAEEQPDLDTTDQNAVKAAVLEGVDVRTWVENKATEMCVDFVMTEQKFDELGLSLSDDDKAYVNMMLEYYWSGSQAAMERNGISEASFTKIVTNSYKSDAIFEYYYGVGGEEGVTEDELYDYYVENTIRCQYVRINLVDGEGNMLKSEGKADMMEMVKDYQKRVEDAYDEGGVEAVMTEMNYVQEDYNYYVTSVSEEAAGVEEPATTTPRTTTTTTTETTAGDGEDATGTADAEETTTQAEAEETTTTTEETTVTEDSDEDAGETDVASDEDTEETTTASDEASEETTTTVAEGEEAEETTTAADEDSEETTTTTAEDATDEETTTTTAPYLNESIISVINVEDYDSEDDINYTPSEKTYKKLLEIGPEDYGKPYIVEEDEQYYLVVRYDIEERMTEDDLWTESTVTNTDYNKYYDAFEELFDSWSNAAQVKRNDAAYKRYNPYKFDFS